jgi:transcriptional regulator with XRE-family HTH domain
MDAHGHQVGINLRRIRRSRGMSLDVLAGRSGLSKSFLSRVERGERALEKRSHLSAVAVALDCSIADLLGEPIEPVGPTRQAAVAGVPALRRALHAFSIGHVETSSAAPIETLRSRAHDLWLSRLASRPVETWRILPGLVADLHAHLVNGDDPREAARLLVEATSAAAFALRGLGYADLAWIAAEACLKAAQEYDDPAAIGLAQYTRAQTSSIGQGYSGALHIAETAADELRPQVGDDPEGLRVYGTLLMMSAWAANVAGGDPEPYRTEAVELGERLGDPDPEDDRWQTLFGRTNNVIWQISAAVEAGDVKRAVQLAEGADVSVIGSKSREAAFWTELGVGLSRIRGSENAAIAALLNADRVAPERTRNNPAVRAAVSRMIDDARSRATGRQLAALAGRVGLDLT